MLSVKTTAMVSLVSALAAVGIVASLKRPAAMTLAPMAAAAPVASVVPTRAATATPSTRATPAPAAPSVPALAVGDDADILSTRRLLMPVQGYDAAKLRDNFNEMRGGVRRHEALDIMAPRGTPVVATDDGVVTKLFRSVAGGITVYQADPSQRLVYYYAHLDRYREGLKEGEALHRGDVIGYVGTTGNAPESAPHLHFTIFVLGPEKKWWKGRAVNPYPYLAAR